MRIAALRRRGVVQTHADSLQLHRVPAALLRARSAGDRQNTGGWATEAVRLLHRAVPADLGSDPRTWPLWRQLLPHVITATNSARDLTIVVAEVSWLLDRASTYLEARGEARAAKPLSERAYTLYRNRLGDDDPATLTAASNYANALRGTSEYTAAHRLDEDTLARRRRILGDNHPDTLTSANNLGDDLRVLREYKIAANSIRTPSTVAVASWDQITPAHSAPQATSQTTSIG